MRAKHTELKDFDFSLFKQRVRRATKKMPRFGEPEQHSFSSSSTVTPQKSIEVKEKGIFPKLANLGATLVDQYQSYMDNADYLAQKLIAKAA